MRVMVRFLGVGKKQKNASGGKVSHLESGLRMLSTFVPQVDPIRLGLRPAKADGRYLISIHK
ncbi:hypothetical protein DSLASN_26300 [Desulfoluna limicola]|uniref:Uncharacterized protein n=1 Tax=Desulfoluna limicola TaxID=2810562 RepID=A0ABN6F3G0_9BACT|nr:hypothetical protein DSLASN_26300 [Desulfoluna limicola]